MVEVTQVAVLDFDAWKRKGLEELERLEITQEEMEAELGNVAERIVELRRMFHPEEFQQPILTAQKPTRKRMPIRPTIVKVYGEMQEAGEPVPLEELIEAVIEELGEGANRNSVATSARRFGDSDGLVTLDGMICVAPSDDGEGDDGGSDGDEE